MNTLNKTFRISRVSPGLVAAALLAASGLSHGQGHPPGQDFDVTKLGSFSPPNTRLVEGGPLVPSPYMLVKSAAAQAQGDVVLIEPGTYRESGVFAGDAELCAPAGGTVVLGNVNAGASTTLRVVSLNTHLAGSSVGGDFGLGTWQDTARMYDIADICIASPWDFVAFSEIWDDALFYFLQDEAKAIYPYWGTGFNLSGDLEHSGLAVMGRNPMVTLQYDYDDCSQETCSGNDCLANKGYTMSSFAKDTFDIVIVNTHMQAGSTPLAILAREGQLQCLGNALLVHMAQNPDNVYFVVGDLNVPSGGNEYHDHLRFNFPLFNDGARNAPGFVLSEQTTNSPINPLAECFDCDTVDLRLDYILYTPQSSDGSVRVMPRSTGRYKFLGPPLTGECDECPNGRDITTGEKSDHWAVEGEYEIYRP